MIVGHTKFSPDWCFGLLKQRLRRCEYNCLNDIVREVENSADVNFAQLAGTQSGEILVPMYNWSNFFQPHFKPLPNIKQYHHFHFTRTCTGVAVKKYSDSESTIINILTSNWVPNFSNVPVRIIPPGLSEERQVYLYNNIRQFCTEDLRDIVFPKPSSLQSSTFSPSSTPPPATVPSTHTTPQKRSRTCSICGEEKHNKRTCPSRH